MKKIKVAILVDDSDQSFLNFDLYKLSLNSEYYEISTLIVNKMKDKNTGGENFNDRVCRIFQNGDLSKVLQHSLFSLIIKLEKYKLPFDYKQAVLDTHSLNEFKVNFINVYPIISKSGLIYRYNDEDLKKIKDYNIDVIVRGGSGILRGKILSSSRFGILSFHHGDNDFYRGGPAGFWEVYHRTSSTGFVIQVLNEVLDGGDVIFKGNIATRPFYTFNLIDLYRKSSIFMHKVIERIAKNDRIDFVYPKKPYSSSLYTYPNIFESSSYLFRFLGAPFLVSRIGRIFKPRKIDRWSVSYVSSSDWKNTVLFKSIVIKNPPYRYLADPFIITNNNQTCIFVEDFDYRKGRGTISAYEITRNGYKELGTVLSEDFHLSYPFLIEENNVLYMLPETYQSKEIRLYKCLEYPLKWTLHKIIMKDVDAADSSIFKHKGKFWLLTNLDSSKMNDHSSELHLYYSDTLDSQEWISHPMNPVIFNSTYARNGGLIMNDEGIFRVYQVKEFEQYGARMGVAKISTLTTISYKEEYLFEITPNYFKDLRGTHTYSYDSISKIAVFDFVKLEKYN